jgi:hypothetical protein
MDVRQLKASLIHAVKRTWRKRHRQGNSGANWVEISEEMWSVVTWSELKWFCFEFKRSKVSCGEIVWDISTMLIMATLCWGYMIVLRLFQLVLSFTVVVLTCVMCGCFGNMCTCIYCALFCLYCDVYCIIYVYWFPFVFFCFSVKTTVTEWKCNCS